MRRDRRNSLLTITLGAVITTLALFMFSIAYPQLFALFSMLFVFSMIIIGLSLLAYAPELPKLLITMIREMERKRKEKWLADINRVRRKMGLRPLRSFERSEIPERRGWTEK